jgi:hypothetical protein
MPWRARTASPYRTDRTGTLLAQHPDPDTGPGHALLGQEIDRIFSSEIFRGVQLLLSAVDLPQAPQPESPPP